MSGTLARYKRDVTLETEGIELDMGEGMVITVRRAGGSNTKYTQVVRREYRKRKHAVDADLLSDEEGREMLAIVYADSVIIGWKGVSGEDGKQIPYNRENVIKTLVAYPEFFDAIQAACQERENFKRVELEAEGKNS